MGTTTKRRALNNIKKLLLAYWPILAIFFVWFIFASPYFLKGLIPFPSKYLVTFFPPWSAVYGMPVKNNAMPDVITQIYPWKKLTIDTWKNGQISLWNPYSFSGTPHAANYQTAVFSPFNLLFLILPFIDAWSVLVLLQPLLAGLFMYLFLRSLDRSKESCFIGSVAFMFCGFLVVWMAYGTLGYAVLWLPLILTAIHRQMIHQSWWNLVLLTIAISFSFLSGHFQISFYVAMLSFVFLIFETVRKKRWIDALPLLIFYIFGILLALPQLLPSYFAYAESFRSAAFGKGEIIPFQYLMTLFSPDFFGNPVTRNDWFGHYAEWAGFVGVLPLLFALYACIGKKNAYIWFFGITAIVILLLATPTIFNDWLFQVKLPVISTSSASRIIVLTSFSLAVLSAFGMDALWLDWKSQSTRRIFGYCLSVASLLTILWLFLLINKPLDLEKLVVAKRNLVLPSIMATVGLLLFLLGLYKNKFVRFFILGTMLFITFFDLLRFATKWMPFDPKQYVYPVMPVISALQKQVGISRMVGNFGGELSMFYNIPSLEGYDAVYQERYGEFMKAVSTGRVAVPDRSVVMIDKHGKFAEQALALLGVRFVLHRLSDDGVGWTYPVWQYPNYHSIYRDNNYEIFENANVFPRAFLASSYVVISNKQSIIDTLFGKGFDRRNTIVLEREPILKPQEGEGAVTITGYTPTEIRFSVDTASPKVLFLSDVYDAGWKGFVDGKQTQVYRADYDFRAVAVPSGKHDVRMAYKPDSVIWGFRIASIVLLILVVGSLREIFYANRHL